MEFGDLLMLIASIGGIVFAVSYATFFRWYKTGPGRTLLALIVSLDLVFLLNILGRLVGPDYWGRDGLRIIIYFAVAVSMWTMVVQLWGRWRKGAGIDLESRKTDSNPQV